MKKFTYLLLIAVMPFISCSSDDEAVEESMFGKWQLSSSVQTIDGQQVPEDLTDCDKKSTVEFSEDGSFTTVAFSEQNGECISVDTSAGTWEDKGNDIYTLTLGSGSIIDRTITLSGSTLSIYYDGNDESGGWEQTSTWTRIN